MVWLDQGWGERERAIFHYTPQGTEIMPAACHTGQIDHKGHSIVIQGGAAMHDAERRALIEYLKAATHEDYPLRVIDRPRAAPCEEDPGWASR